MRRSISTIPSLCSAQEYVYMRKRPSRRDWPEKWKGKISQKWRTIRRERKLNTRPLRRQINKRLGLLTRQDNVFQGICLGERVQRDVSWDGSRAGSIKDIKIVYKDLLLTEIRIRPYWEYWPYPFWGKLSPISFDVCSWGVPWTGLSLPEERALESSSTVLPALNSSSSSSFNGCLLIRDKCMHLLPLWWVYDFSHPKLTHHLEDWLLSWNPNALIPPYKKSWITSLQLQ